MQFACLHGSRHDLISRLDRISVMHHLPNRRSPPESSYQASNIQHRESSGERVPLVAMPSILAARGTLFTLMSIYNN